MKNVKFFTLGLAVFALAALFTSCQKDKDGPNDPNLESRASSKKHEPNWQSGNAASECAQAEAGADCDKSLKIDPPLNGFYEHEGNTIVVTFSADGKKLSWSSDYKVCAVIVKGGNNGANVYYYAGGACSDGGLEAPLNNNKNKTRPDISHVTFCWGDVECEDECTWKEETAWGGSYPGGGNAWWYYFDTNGSATQSIYAGQYLTAGDVTYANGNLTINLGSWQLQNVDEPVKIQAYNELPASKPTPGLFTTYKGNSLIVPVTHANYYAIHLDVEICK
jgi:hypothetical protein